ncbi:MAG: hypothetical protein V9F01_17915 [Chitinophagaceae bacterium]
MRRTIYCMLAFLLLCPVILFSQGLREGKQNSPLPYFDKNSDGYVVLRDGSRLEGTISIKNYEKEGGISLTDRSGQKYKVDVRSLSSWGLNMVTPVCVSPLSWFEWSSVKQKENKEAERGFVVLRNGEVKDGKIKIEGESSDESLPGANDFFALEKLTFVDKSGAKTVYTKEQVKEYGRILPWTLAPAELFAWQASVTMGKRRTKAQDGGLVIMNDGRKLEGKIQLVSINTMNADEKANKIKTDMVDEIRIGDNKVDMDDVFAYGLSNLTINMLTNNQDKSYSVEEMNFHPGSVTTKDGKKYEGFVAFFPNPGSYYGVYVASKFDSPVTIINMKEIDKVEQNISLIEEFDPTAPAEKTTSTNSNINGYIVALDGTKFEGTVTLTGDKEFWCAGIDFVDKNNQASKFGGENKRISYCVVNGNLYVQHETVFMKAEKTSTPLAVYNNPYPENSSFLSKTLVELANSSEFQNLVNSAAMRVSMGAGMNLSDAYNTGKGAGQRLATIINKIGKGKSGGDPYRSKKGNDFFIIDTRTGEMAKASDNNWELLLEGCKAWHTLDKKEQKQLLDSGTDKIVEYINAAYGKNSKGF